ncbi:MAG TPA: response regulator transcription factor [Ktedonobacteraceae bacterium]|jgi:DNA-binding NarL/FixJ family response regulator|nr:response regulator transcription factor [Ktedonobacteraceae bacterium]
MIRILLADDHPIVREGLRAVLETQTDFEVIAECATGDEALRLSSTLHPDMMLLDLEMPIMDGVETIRRLRQMPHPPRIIVFTAFDNDERIIHAIQAGADGYLLKGAPREEIFNAVRVTMQGGSLLQPLVASKLLRHVGQQHVSGTPARQMAKVPPIEALTERELEVLRLLAQGMPNKEIATHLVISERTAKFHVSSIMGKLGATNRTEAVSLAAQRGLITLHG